MNPEEKALLERVAGLSEENNKILRGMKRSARWATAFRALYWIIVLGVSFGAYVAIQPYIDQLSQAYRGFNDSVDTVKTIGSKIPDFSGLLK